MLQLSFPSATGLEDTSSGVILGLIAEFVVVETASIEETTTELRYL